MKRKFEVEMRVLAVVELDDAVIEAVDDEWRSMFYKLHTPEDIAEHIAYNLIINKWPLSSLDGWANLPDDFAKLVEVECDLFEAVELKEENE